MSKPVQPSQNNQQNNQQSQHVEIYQIVRFERLGTVNLPYLNEVKDVKDVSQYRFRSDRGKLLTLYQYFSSDFILNVVEYGENELAVFVLSQVPRYPNLFILEVWKFSKEAEKK